MKIWIIFLLLIAAFFCACHSEETDRKQTPLYYDSSIVKEKTNETRPLILKGDEAGWGANIRMSLTEIKQQDSFTLYRTNSKYRNYVIGFDIIVPTRGKGRLIFKRNSSASDSFVAVLSSLYKQKPASHFADSAVFTCINMGDFIKGLKDESGQPYELSYEYKLFYEGKKPDEYAELFLNINEKEHWIEIAEKDEEYRKAIIRLLSNN